jgi:hypothetical protein
VSFTAIILCVASQQVFVVVVLVLVLVLVVYFIINSVQKRLDTPSYNTVTETYPKNKRR